ncbi:hypothetical protein [Mucilaginibacter flavus]|uniref:hypothetical protein n=1 Tax=Mucilaginibacter flavus TaxID=931504 RepID=UPI0025B32CD0|nr:hypothetical protein [Mucilaginibacter flavus]MDN3579750.1 hypothetical protein [Mucilaginibacter flavus]
MPNITEQTTVLLDQVLKAKPKIREAEEKIKAIENKKIKIGSVEPINVSSLDENYEHDLEINKLKKEISNLENDLEQGKKGLFELYRKYQDRELSVLYAGEIRKLIVSWDEDELYKENHKYFINYNGADL